MRFLSRATENEYVYRDKARKRLARMPTMDVLNWADQAGSGVAKSLDDFRKQGHPSSLDDAKTGLEALLGVVEELQSRTQ